MSFKTKKYQVIKGALSKELANFIFNYMLLQRDAVDFMVKNNKVNPVNPFIGNRVDHQIPGAYSKYADWVMETLLMFMIPIMKAKTGMELLPTYSYTRLYGADNILSGRETTTVVKPGAPKGVRVDLKVGDMLIYSGCELEHWREPFQGNICSQVFLHYNHAKGPFSKTNLLDGRPLLGIPK